MRIVGGKLSGRRIQPPANKWPTRPTTDYAREALFNILEHRIDWSSTSMLDLFGGTGAISMESASRGCLHVTYVERYYPCVQFMKKCVDAFNIKDQVDIVKSDVFKFLKQDKHTYDLIFADPPYDLKRMLDIPQLILESGLLKDSGTLIIEHGPQSDMGGLSNFKDARKYGSSVFSFFEA